MTSDAVADAFISLLLEGSSGSVISCWNKVPLYYIPVSGMALFIFYTTCAMICRWIPGVNVVRPWMMVVCAFGILASWYLGGLLISTVFAYL